MEHKKLVHRERETLNVVLPLAVFSIWSLAKRTILRRSSPTTRLWRNLRERNREGQTLDCRRSKRLESNWSSPTQFSANAWTAWSIPSWWGKATALSEIVWWICEWKGDCCRIPWLFHEWSCNLITWWILNILLIVRCLKAIILLPFLTSFHSSQIQSNDIPWKLYSVKPKAENQPNFLVSSSNLLDLINLLLLLHHLHIQMRRMC